MRSDEVRSVKCEVRSVKSALRSVKRIIFGTQIVTCGDALQRSGAQVVFLDNNSATGWQEVRAPAWVAHAHASSIDGKGLIL